MANIITTSDVTKTVTITSNNTTLGTVNQGSTSIVQVNSTGPQGPTGPQGDKGDKGNPGELTSAENLTITGSLFVSGANGNVTASGNISSSGLIIGSNLTGSNTGDQDLSSFITNLQTSSMSVLTSSFAITASHALNSSGGSVLTASYTSEWVLGANGTNHYTFSGPGLTGAENDPDIYLIRGQKYRFYNNSGGHPFRIQSTPNGSAGTAYNDGITNNNAGNGTYLLFDVQFDAPTKLYYQCTSHPNMGGPIYIADTIESSGSFSGSFKGDGSQLTGIASIPPPIVFKLTKETDYGDLILDAGIINVALHGLVDPSQIIAFSTSSFNGVELAPLGIGNSDYFQDLGSFITLISTSSGKFIKLKTVNDAAATGDNTIKFVNTRTTWQTSSAGMPDAGDIVEFRWDNSAQIGSAKPIGAGAWMDPTSTRIDVQIKSSSIFWPAAGTIYESEEDISFSDTLYVAASISKSLDLTVNSLNTTTHISASGNITASGNISSSGFISAFGSSSLHGLPTSKPTTTGSLWLSGSAGQDSKFLVVFTG
jgi:hypothetical protein